MIRVALRLSNSYDLNYTVPVLDNVSTPNIRDADAGDVRICQLIAIDLRGTNKIKRLSSEVQRKDDDKD